MRDHRAAPADDAVHAITDDALLFHARLVEQLTPRRRTRIHAPALLVRLLPDPCRSDRQFERFEHRDIPSMSRRRAGAEAHWIRTLLNLALDPDQLADSVPPWLFERLRRLDEWARAS